MLIANLFLSRFIQFRDVDPHFFWHPAIERLRSFVLLFDGAELAIHAYETKSQFFERPEK
ncbi:hypothetical protein [Noviherbaspirillum sp.]|uniref:hypothetical protein n=1 Tax=Noviherbaspirillum sp. TaxID=1926288 RepID=UPI002B465D26|nr:hypothetical protein [Noviherbaspirillum sp.]HJV79888.1 hypothetical protein [Noviherbaspirillum sp.]